MSWNKLKYGSCRSPFSAAAFLHWNKRYSGKQDRRLFVDKVCVIAAKHRRIRKRNATRNTSGQRTMLLLTTTGTFTLVVEPEWIYSLSHRVRTHTHTHTRASEERKEKTKEKKSDSEASVRQALISVLLSLVPSPVCVFTFEFSHTYQDQCVWGRARKVIMLRRLENGSLFWIYPDFWSD